MSKTTLNPNSAFPLTPKEQLSFAGPKAAYRIAGPLRLVRLQQFGGNALGKFWFEERVFNRVRARAIRELLRQGASNKQAFSRPLQELVGMYMKHCLRSDLAISKDWTPNFDSYVSLALGPADAVVAWVGLIANQPYYSKPSPADPKYADKKAVYDLAEANGVSLLAAEKQYVIDFDFPANRPLKNLIRGPRPF